MIEAPPTPSHPRPGRSRKQFAESALAVSDTLPAQTASPAQTDSASPNRASSAPDKKRGLVVRIVGMALVVLLGVVLGIAMAGAGAPSTNSTTRTVNAAARYFDKTYGTFAVESASGFRDSVLNLPSGEAGLVTATYGGQGDFAIVELDATNQLVSLLVETSGSYSGTTAFGIAVATSVKLGIDASGPWTVTLAPFSSAPSMQARNRGTGDAVYLYTGSAADWAVAYDVQGDLVVTSYDTSPLGVDLLVDTIGAYRGTVPAASGPAVVVIEASGPWTLAVR